MLLLVNVPAVVPREAIGDHAPTGERTSGGP